MSFIQTLSDTVVLSFPEYKIQSQQLAAQLHVPCLEIKIHHFPDGESKLTLPERLPAHVIFHRSLDHPNPKLIELMLASTAAREAGAQQLTLVAPYLCYMRQDKAFSPGEIISQQIIGQFLAQHFDNVITVDAHLHRINTLQAAIPIQNAINLSATQVLGEFLLQQNIEPLLLGPDLESKQWVRQIAKIGGFDFTIAEKQRFGDCNVSIQLPDTDFTQRTVVIVDDVVSSGHTTATASKQVLEAGAKTVHCLVTHALFAPEALPLLSKAGIEKIWSSDSIPHTSNVTSLSPLIAKELQRLIAE
ncbi:MAG: ribose-phosphate diphosphokinase [Gammaproteobacteria bacterium]|nr:ribose-phosphate diphosphokinase [Gammaproteobacteria bacterium]